MDLGQFYALMEDHGYTVKHHGNYPSFIPDGYAHPYRIKRKGKTWTEDDIERFIDRAMSDPTFEVIMPKVQKAFVPYGKLHGFRALYVSWMYVLGIIGQGKRTQYPRVNYKELKRFEQYKAQAAFLDRRLRKRTSSARTEGGFAAGSLPATMTRSLSATASLRRSPCPWTGRYG